MDPFLFLYVFAGRGEATLKGYTAPYYGWIWRSNATMPSMFPLLLPHMSQRGQVKKDSSHWSCSGLGIAIVSGSWAVVLKTKKLDGQIC